MADVTVNSWSELQDELFRELMEPGDRQYRSAFVFRGLSDTTYPWTPPDGSWRSVSGT
ncbi:MAG: hypothetical protein R2874_15250 [Desulfobacterales bacterium]